MHHENVHRFLDHRHVLCTSGSIPDMLNKIVVQSLYVCFTKMTWNDQIQYMTYDMTYENNQENKQNCEKKDEVCLYGQLSR
jgi:hypothetical protein